MPDETRAHASATTSGGDPGRGSHDHHQRQRAGRAARLPAHRLRRRGGSRGRAVLRRHHRGEPPVPRRGPSRRRRRRGPDPPPRPARPPAPRGTRATSSLPSPPTRRAGGERARRRREPPTTEDGRPRHPVVVRQREVKVGDEARGDPPARAHPRTPTATRGLDRRRRRRRWTSALENASSARRSSSSGSSESRPTRARRPARGRILAARSGIDVDVLTSSPASESSRGREDGRLSLRYGRGAAGGGSAMATPSPGGRRGRRDGRKLGAHSLAKVPSCAWRVVRVRLGAARRVRGRRVDNRREPDRRGSRQPRLCQPPVVTAGGSRASRRSAPATRTAAVNARAWLPGAQPERRRYTRFRPTRRRAV